MVGKHFSDGLVTPEGSVRFHTLYYFVASGQGGGWPGSCDLLFCTPEDQPNYVTMLSPEGVRGLISNLMSVYSSQPNPSRLTWAQPSGRISGTISYGPDTKTYFGQNYKIDVIQALGVLLIRANIIDQALIDLYSALTGMTQQQASAQYYSSVNMKARLDGARALIDASELPKETRDLSVECLDRIKQASDRRNDLVHGRWTFRKGKHRVELYRPNSKNKLVELTINEQHVLDIAEAYSTVTGMLFGCISAISQVRNASSSTARTPSSGDPES